MTMESLLGTTESLLGKVRNRVAFVGVELEGGWIKLPRGVDGLVRDGSVSFPELPAPAQLQRAVLNAITTEERTQARNAVSRWVATQPAAPQHIGELPSPVLKVQDLHGWLQAHYPSHVNKSCGMHLHMSFNTLLTYQRLMTNEFEGVMLNLLAKWGHEEHLGPKHPLWDRLAGKSNYCTVGNKHIDAQARIASKSYSHSGVNRYTAVNYSYGTHGTIELRVLPMMDTVDLAYSALWRAISITNAFLLTQVQREKPEVVHVADSNAIEIISSQERI